MADYRDPLYAVVTIDPENAKVAVEGKDSQWKNKSSKQLGYFEQKGSVTEKM